MEQPDAPTQRMPILPEGTAEVNVPLELDKLDPPESRAINRDPATAPTPVRMFVSYAHAHERAIKRLDAILDVLEQQHGLVPWRDQRLIAGDEWDHEIRRRLEDMDIFFFVASQRSLASGYIRDPEIKRARERHERGEVEIVTVKLEPCACDEDPYLGKLQRLAPKYSSIAKTNPRSEAWEQVRRDLLPVIKRVREKKEKRARASS
jgi:TIR domain